MSNPVRPTWLSQDMADAGFAIPEDGAAFALSVCSSGAEKKGKTHFAFTAPKPLVCLASDTGTAGIARRFKAEDNRIAVLDYRVPPSGQARTEYEKEWLKMEKSMTAVLLNKSIRSFVADTWTEIWEMLRLARFGKLTQVMPMQYGPVNNEMRDIVKSLVDRADLNVVFIHKVKKTYATNKAGVDAWNGKWERAGFGDMGYLSDIVIEHFFDPGDEDGNGREFGVRVKDSRYNTANIVGNEYRGDLCNFAMLASDCFPTTDLSYWLDE